MQCALGIVCFGSLLSEHSVEEREFGTVKCRAGTLGDRVLFILLVVARCSGPLHLLSKTRSLGSRERVLLFEIPGEVFASYTTSPADQRESRSPGAYCEGNRFVPLDPGSALRLAGDVDRRRRCGRLFEFLNTRRHPGKCRASPHPE